MVLLLSCPFRAVGAETTETAGEVEQEAGRLYLSGRYDDALSLLEPLFHRADISLDALFLYGLSSLGVALEPDIPQDRMDELLDAAAAAFRAMLSARPELERPRLELARVLFMQGEDGPSRRHFEHVLAGKPPQAVMSNVRDFLSRIRDRRRWSLHAGISLAPDTNIGNTSDERVLWINGLPFLRDAEELTTSGVGLLAWGGGEYQHPLGEGMRLRAGGGVNLREYEGRRFDSVLVSGHAGPRWFIGRDAQASVLADVQRSWRAGVPEYDALGGRVEGVRRMTRRLQGRTQIAWLDKRYRTRTDLDGPSLNISLNTVWASTPAVRVEAGVGWGRERPQTRRSRHQQRWIHAAASVDLPQGFTVGASASLSRADYEGQWFPYTDGSPRRDRTRKLRVSVHRRNLSWKGFSPQLSVVREVRSSNSQLQGYRRTGGELSFVRVF